MAIGLGPATEQRDSLIPTDPEDSVGKKGRSYFSTYGLTDIWERLMVDAPLTPAGGTRE